MKDRHLILSRRKIGVLICAILIIASLIPIISSSGINLKTKNSKEVETIEYCFKFDSPKFESISVYDSDFSRVSIPGCLSLGRQAGEPSLPVRFIKMIIPAFRTVSAVKVEGSPMELNLGDINLIEKPVFPYQNPYPFGFEPEEFKLDTEFYNSNAFYPNKIQNDYNIGYSRGYAILDMSLNPLKYNPGEGKLLHYSEMTVTIELEETEYVNQFLRENRNDKAWVEKLVYNPEETNSYDGIVQTFDYDGGLCDPDDNYDYVIITTEHEDLNYWDTTTDIPYNWESLMEKHENEDGLSCTLVTIQEITACDDYHNDDPLFNDLQAHIREFCKDAYQDWGTTYVLIGGDDEWIPARHMRYDYENNVDSDLYWSNLDKTFNDDHDNNWGEEGDLGFDLYTEIFIGRLTCDEPKDVSNWMTKSFYYADNMDIDYLDNAAFYGGNTGWQCQGDDFIDYGAIKGTDDWLGPNPGDHGEYPDWLGFQFGFETWNSENDGVQYNLSEKWTGEPPNEGWQGGNTNSAISGLREAINNNRVTILSGIAHAHSGMSLDVDDDEWESNYHNTQPFFINDFGCHCGDMDASDDGVLHSMLFHSNSSLAFACIYHTSYGWGGFMDTNSSSALQMKCFYDYLFDKANNSGSPSNWQLGKAMAWSKDVMAPTINWTYNSAPGSWRGTIQACLLFGDPAQKLKIPGTPPEKPPIPSGPSEAVIFEPLTFTTSTIDPAEDQVFYRWNWGDGTISEWDGPHDSGAVAEGSYIWHEIGEYEITVQAKDIFGILSEWSDPFHIILNDNDPPIKPTISGPKVVSSKKEITYTFSSTDPQGHELWYFIDWGNGFFENWIGPYDSGEEIELSHAWSSGEYTIKVKTKDIADYKSPQCTLKINVVKERTHNYNIELPRFMALFGMFWEKLINNIILR